MQNIVEPNFSICNPKRAQYLAVINLFTKIACPPLNFLIQINHEGVRVGLTMVALRTCRASIAAGVFAAAAAFHPAASPAAQILEVQQPAAASQEASEPSGPDIVPQLQLVQFPPPPYYIDRNFKFRSPWFENEERSVRSRRLRRPRDSQSEPFNNEHEVVREQVETGKSAGREPNYFLTRHLRGNYKQRIATVLRHSPRLAGAKGPLLITISIAKQTITAYDAGVQVAKGPVSTGMPGHSTPMGVFSVLEKEWWHRSNLYSGAPMPFMQRLTWSGIAMHAGELPGYRASHGCIRLPESFALRLWYTSNVGARVVIAYNELAPAEIEHPLLFQPRPGPQPVPLPQPPANPSTSIPYEDIPVSRNVPSSPQDIADAERDRMMLATADDGESVEAADEDTPSMQFALDIHGTLEPQPVLEFLSARRKIGGRNYARGPEAEYAAVGKPNTGSLSIFISRRDGRLYVRKDAQPLFDLPITIAEPEKPLGTHVFTAVSEESASKLRWTVVSPSNQAAADERTPAGALDRITLPQAAVDRIDDLISAGTTLIVSDAGLGRTAAVPNADFAVVLH